jgi:hypothetical protein
MQDIIEKMTAKEYVKRDLEIAKRSKQQME